MHGWVLGAHGEKAHLAAEKRQCNTRMGAGSARSPSRRRGEAMQCKDGCWQRTVSKP